MTQDEITIDENRRSWDEAIRRHNRSKGNLAALLARGHSFVPDEITAFLPSSGQLLLQPFCNDGRELLSLANRFDRCIGVDFSPAAIDSARGLSTNSSCEFVCAEVGEWLSARHEPLASAVFSSLGCVWWIPNLTTYFGRLRARTTLGSTYVMWDFHPFLSLLGKNLRVDHSYPFQQMQTQYPTGIVDYVSDQTSCFIGERRDAVGDDTFDNPYPVTEFLRGIGAIVDSACSSGWHVREIREFPYIIGERYHAGLVDIGGNRFGFPDGVPNVPLTFVLVLTNGI